MYHKSADGRFSPASMGLPNWALIVFHGPDQYFMDAVG